MRRSFSCFSCFFILLVVLMLAVPYPVYASPAFLSRAFIAYRSSTGTSTSYPKYRDWNTTKWLSETEMATSAGSAVRWVRVAYGPRSRWFEKVVVTLSDDGYLDAYVWNGTTWLVTNNIGNVGTTANAYRAFDVAYENATGRALLVYSRGTTTLEIGYRIWNQSSWSAETTVELTYTSGMVNWLALASAPGTRSGTGDNNEIAMIYIDSAVDVHGYVWTGTAWSLMGAAAVWDATAAIATTECIAVAYEQTSGEALFIWADATTDHFNYRTWDGTTLGASTDLTIAACAAVGNWLVLKSRPGSNGILFGEVDGGADLNTLYWNGAAWDTATEHPEHDASVDGFASRVFDLDWERDGTDALLVYGDGSNAPSLVWEKGTPTTGSSWWTGPTDVVGSATQDNGWVQLRRNLRNEAGDVMILGAVLDDNEDIGSLKWDGTTLTFVAAAFTADTGFGATPPYYECFELEFMRYIPATSTMKVVPTSTTTSVGFTIQIWVYEAVDLYGWEFKLYYKTSVITCPGAGSVTEGPFLAKGGGTFYSVKEVNNAYNATHGRIWATCTLLAAPAGVPGNGRIASISFNVVASGVSPLDLQDTKMVGYYNNNLYALTHTALDGTVTVIGVPEFPLGAAMEIALAAVIVYFWWKRKNKGKPYNLSPHSPP